MDGRDWRRALAEHAGKCSAFTALLVNVRGLQDYVSQLASGGGRSLLLSGRGGWCLRFCPAPHCKVCGEMWRVEWVLGVKRGWPLPHAAVLRPDSGWISWLFPTIAFLSLWILSLICLPVPLSRVACNPAACLSKLLWEQALYFLTPNKPSLRMIWDFKLIAWLISQRLLRGDLSLPEQIGGQSLGEELSRRGRWRTF